MATYFWRNLKVNIAGQDQHQGVRLTSNKLKSYKKIVPQAINKTA